MQFFKGGYRPPSPQEEIYPEEILFVGGLFAIVRLPSREDMPPQVALFVEDDESYFYQCSFAEEWLTDLAKVAEMAKIASEYGKKKAEAKTKIMKPPYEGTFLGLCVRGVVTVEDVDIFTELWHESAPPPDSPNFVQLHDFLGMTWEQYRGWVEHPDSLPTLIETLKIAVGKP